MHPDFCQSLSAFLNLKGFSSLLKSCEVGFFSYPRATNPNQLSLGRKYKEDKPLLPWDRLAKINPKHTVKTTAQLHGERAYLAFSAFYSRAAHAQRLPQATNTAFLAAKLIPWCSSSMPSLQAAVEPFHWELKWLTKIVIANRCLVRFQCLWINELSN